MLVLQFNFDPVLLPAPSGGVSAPGCDKGRPSGNSRSFAAHRQHLDILPTNLKLVILLSFCNLSFLDQIFCLTF